MTFLKVWGSSHTSHPFCTSFTHLCVRLAGSQAPKQCFVNAYFIAPGAPRQLQCFGGLEAAWTPNLTHCSGSQSHSGSSQGLGGAVASCQSRAGHQIQPADPWICQRVNTPCCQDAVRLSRSCQQAVKRKNIFCPNTFSRVNKPKY